jgi:dynamin 1-like protein
MNAVRLGLRAVNNICSKVSKADFFGGAPVKRSYQTTARSLSAFSSRSVSLLQQQRKKTVFNATADLRAPTVRLFHASFIVNADYKSNVKPIGNELIPTVNKLQEIFAMVGTELDLPQIVVVGGQSSGKSSVLENLVGRDFLPRGTDIVTRRPLILQLNRNETNEEYGEFLHKGGHKYHNFEDIKKEIENETERIAGKNKGISKQPILLKVYSPHVINLTLVDTPGIARIPVGDQPSDIEERIRELIREFISKPNAIILAVQSANQDLATSDALKLAREVDPEGNRTLGVLTKLDLMDKGTDAMNVLTGLHIPLKHGWIGVVNRSQRDILNRKPITEALQDEREFFARHSQYHILGQKVGTTFLGHRCNELLTDHIRKTLPGLRNQVRDLIAAKKAELATLGEDTQAYLANTPAAKGWLLLQIINRFAQEFKAAIEGLPNEIETKELNGGARIRYIFHESFVQNLNKISATTNLTLSDIRTALRNAAGPKASLFVPDAAFELLAKRQIEMLRDPAHQCAEVIHSELMRIVQQLEAKDLQRYPKLRLKILETANHMMKKLVKQSNALVEQLIALELTYINTSHPDFVGLGLLKPRQEDTRDVELERMIKDNNNDSGSSGIFGFLFGAKPKPESKPIEVKKDDTPRDFGSAIRVTEEISEREMQQIKLIKQLLSSYFDIVKKSVQDHTVKAIMLTLVNSAKDNMQRELVSSLYKEELYDDLLYESDEVGQKRKKCTEELAALKQAKKIIQLTELMVDWKQQQSTSL